jgi:hypothetical protein
MLQDPICNKLLDQRLLKPTWSTGDLFGLLRDTIARARACRGCLFYIQLYNYYLT